MGDKRSSMREGPLSDLFRPTTETPQSAEPESTEDDRPAWGHDPSSAMAADRSNYLAVIKCVGIGGAGVNAIDRMIEAGIRGVEFIAVNTDRQSLDASDADVRIPVGLELTRGRGTGGNAGLGEQAVRENEEQLRRALRGADLVFIAAGEGGGTGTGGAPVVAKLAREMGALTIAVVTRPFAFEGSRRQQMADAGIAALRDQADTIIVIQNDRLMSVLDRNVSMVNAFRVCDDLLRQGVQGITDLITLPGLINLDFADVRTVIRGAGAALLGIGYASGSDRAEEAALAAISSPLLETPIDGAQGILLGITGGPDLSLTEISRAAKVVSDAADPEANIIFGATVDPELEGKVWVTVVAAGFTGRRAARSRDGVSELPRRTAEVVPSSTPASASGSEPTPIGSAPSASTPIFPPLTPAPPQEPDSGTATGEGAVFDIEDPPPITPIVPVESDEAVGDEGETSATDVESTEDRAVSHEPDSSASDGPEGGAGEQADESEPPEGERTQMMQVVEDAPAEDDTGTTDVIAGHDEPRAPAEPVFHAPGAPDEPPEPPDLSAIDEEGRETAMQEAAAKEDIPPSVKELFGSRAEDMQTQLFGRRNQNDDDDTDKE